MKTIPIIQQVGNSNIKDQLRSVYDWFLIMNTSILNHSEVSSLKAILSEYDTLSDNILAIENRVTAALTAIYNNYNPDGRNDIVVNGIDDGYGKYTLGIDILIVTQDNEYRIDENVILDAQQFRDTEIMLDYERGVYNG